MENSNELAEVALQIEYLDDIAIIKATGDLRGGPPDKFEKAMQKAVERGYRFVVVDLYNSGGIDQHGIGDIIKGLQVLLSSDPKAEFAIVQHRDAQEWEQGKLITWNWYMKERSYYDRGDAIEGLRRRASALDMS
jgi:hypothetical protein